MARLLLLLLSFGVNSAQLSSLLALFSTILMKVIAMTAE